MMTHPHGLAKALSLNKRRMSVIASALVLSVLAIGVTSARAETTVPFQAQFQVTACDGGGCGTGSVAGLGSAELTISSITFTPGTPCERVTADFLITLSGGTITLHVDGDACTPGSSSLFRVDAPFTITGGTGAFAGASGGGTAHDVLPGSAAGLNHAQLGGWLTLP